MSKSITREQFITAWNKKCIKTFGLGHEDLPDILFIDDFWYDGITTEEAENALDDMLESMRDEFGFYQ